MKKDPSKNAQPRQPTYRKKTVRTSKGTRHHAVVTINRKDIVLGKWNSPESKKEYKRVIADLIADNAGSQDHAVTITELCVDYTRAMKQRYRDADGNPTEEFNSVQRIMKDLRANYGDTNAAEFKAMRFKAMRQTFVDKGNCRYVVNKYCQHITRAFKLAAENEKLSPENYQSMRAVETLRKGQTDAKETDPITPVSMNTIDQTIEHLHGIAADMVRLQVPCHRFPVDTQFSSDPSLRPALLM